MEGWRERVGEGEVKINEGERERKAVISSADSDEATVPPTHFSFHLINIPSE